MSRKPKLRRPQKSRTQTLLIVLFAALAVLVLLLRPQGLFGTARIRR